MSNLATITNNILADSGIDDINVVVTTGSYADPAWIVSLPWTKITGAPAFVTNVTATSPLFSSGGATPNLTIQQATTSQNGFLSSTDWNTFNNKAPSVVGGYLPLSGGTMTGPLISSFNTTSEPLVNATFSGVGGANIGGILVNGTAQAHVRFLVGSNTWGGAGAKQWQIRVGAGASADDFRIYSWTYADDILYINGPSGNVGINSAPDASSKLKVTSTDVHPNVLRLENNNTTINEAGIRMRAINPTGTAFAHADIGVYSTGSDTGNFFIKFPFSNDKQTNVRFALNSAGNLMLGTTTATTGFSRLSLVGGEPSGIGPNTGVQLTYNAGTFGGGAITTVNAQGGGLAFYTFTGNVGSETYALSLTIGSSSAATFTSSVTATSIIRSGGTSSQFLMADGSVNTSVLPSGAYLPLAGGTLTGTLTISGLGYGNSLVVSTNSANGADIRLTNTSTGGKVYNITSTGVNNALGAGGLQFYAESDGAVAFGVTSSRNFVVNTNADAGFRFNVNGTGRFFESLIVGAAVTTVTQQLSVYGATDTRAEVVSTSNNSAGTYFRVLNGGTLVGQSTIRVSNSGVLEIFCGGASEALRLSISASGATFTGSVQAGGNIISRTANYPQIVFQETTSSTDSLIFYDNVAATKQMGFRVNSGSNVMTLTSTNVLIGTTIPNGSTLRVNGTGWFDSGVTTNGASAVNGTLSVSAGTTAEFAFYANSNSTFAFGSTNGRRGAIIAHSSIGDSGLQFGWDTVDKTGIIAGSANVTGAGIDFYTFNGSSWGNRVRIPLSGGLESLGAFYTGGTRSGSMSNIYSSTNNIFYAQSSASGIQAAGTNSVTNGSIVITNTGGTGAYSIIGNAGLPSGYGLFIQSQDRTAASYYPLLLQPNGGNVLVGTTNDVGAKLYVDGGIRASGAFIGAGLLEFVGAWSASPYNGSSWIRAANGVGLFLVNNAITRWAGFTPSSNFDINGGAFWINSSNSKAGFGTNNPLGSINNGGVQIDRGGHATLLIGNGTGNGGVVQSSDNTRRVFIGANVYDDEINSWSQFVDASGYAAFDAIGGDTLGLSRILVGSPADSGYGGGNIFFEAYKDNSTSYVRLRTNTDNALFISNAGRTILGSESDNGYKLQVVNGNTWSNGVRIGRDFSITNRATVRLDSNGDEPADILFGRTAAALQTSWDGVFWSLSSRGSGEGNEFRIYRGVANTGGSEIQALRITPSAGAAIFINTVTATAFFESSDKRLKSSILDLDVNVSSIIAKTYLKNGVEEIGYLAQDVESILPSAISKREDGYLDLSYRQVHTAKIAYLEKRITELEQQLKNK